MSQTYYFKLPMYLYEGTTPRNVLVEFDGVEVAMATIAATDASSAQDILFTAEKEPGFYTLQVSATEKVEPWACVVIDDIWISIDNTNWKSMIVNGVPSSDSADMSYGFNPAKGAHLFGEDETCSWNISLVDSASWNTQYRSFAECYTAYTDEQLAERFNNDADLIQKYKIAFDLYTARGYS